ncbi:MAG: hypothetical protein ACRDHF_03315 [Tepidiformaceae bacterium]
MEHGLAQISALPQVGGAFICDNRGDVIVSSSPAVLATVTMSAMGREVGRIVGALESSGRPASRLDFTYSNWRLLAMDLGDAILLVVCHANVDMSFVGMTTDIVLTGWRRDADVQRRLQRHRVEREPLVSRTNAARPQRATWRTLEPNSQ